MRVLVVCKSLCGYVSNQVQYKILTAFCLNFVAFSIFNFIPSSSLPDE